MHLKQNTELQNGKYRIIHVLGQGGFGITYLAENILLGNQVAIKEFFPKDYCGRNTTSHLTLGTESNRETVEKLKSRFLKEARNIAKLDHPGIVRVFDVFEENDTAYYVMEYIHGENLNEIVKQNGPLSEVRSIRYISEVGSSLEYIHSKNMTHFDVKPANIIIRKKDDFPILIDFGLSKQYDSKGDATSTMMQAVSHGYSPIELYNAGSVSEFSPQTDVYSLAATLYFVLLAERPLLPTQIMEEGIPFPNNFNYLLRQAITKALSVKRDDRHLSAKAFCAEINRGQVNHTDESTSIIQNRKNYSTTTAQYPETQNQMPFENNSVVTPVGKTNTNTKIWLIISLVIIAFIIILLISKNISSNSSEKDVVNADTIPTMVKDPNYTTSPASEIKLNQYGPFSSKSEIIDLIETFQNKIGQRIIDTSVLAPTITTDFGKPVTFTKQDYIKSVEDYWNTQHYIEGSWNYDWNSLTLIPQEDGGIVVGIKSEYKMVCEKNEEPYTRLFQCNTQITFNKDRKICYYKERIKKIGAWVGY